jgi:hypothetical protein
MKTCQAIIGLGLMLPASVTAQSFNIDCGTGLGVPTSAYGAAAAQPGFWNQIASVAGGAPITLNNLSGAATPVTITSATSNPSFSFNNPATTGDNQALMDDLLDLGGAGAMDTFTISGLMPGNYTVYTYAGAPDDGTFVTSVNVNGTGAQNVGGPWTAPFMFQQGVHYALHTVTISAGTITINTATVNGFSSLNGIQIVFGPPGHTESQWATNLSGNWHVPTNWIPQIVPDNGALGNFNVIIDRPDPANPIVTVDLPAVTICNLLNRDTVRLPGGQTFAVTQMLINDAGGTFRADGGDNILRPGTLNNLGAILLNPNAVLQISPLAPPAPPPNISHHGGIIDIQPGATLAITGGVFTQQGIGPDGAIIGMGAPPAPPPTLAISNLEYNYQGGIIDVDQWLITNSTLNIASGPILFQIPEGNNVQLNGASIAAMGSAPQVLFFGNLRAVGAMSTVSVPLVLTETGSLAIDTATTLRFTESAFSAGLIKVTTPGEVGADAVWSFGPGVINTSNSGPIQVIDGDLMISHDQATSQFTNTGMITVAVPQELTVHSGNFVHNGSPSAPIQNSGLLRAESGGVFEINNTAVTGGGGLAAIGATMRLNNTSVAADRPINIISTMAVSSVFEIMSGSALTCGANAPIVVGSSMTMDGSTAVCDSPICVINGFAPNSEMMMMNSSCLTLNATSKLESEGCVQVESGSDIGGTGDINIKEGAAEGTQNGALICSGTGTTVLAGDVLLELGTSIDVLAAASVGSKGDFLFALQNEADWSWSEDSQMRLTGGVGMGPVGPLGYARLEVGGTDLGFDPVNHVGNPMGFVENFDLAELSIGPGAHVTLVDCFDNGNGANAREALYVDTLRFEDSSARLNLNGIHLYFNTLDPPGALNQIEDLPSGIPGPVDCDTDLADFAGLQNCYGEAAPFMIPCGSYDLDGNETIAKPDYVLFQQTFNGPD